MATILRNICILSMLIIMSVVFSTAAVAASAKANFKQLILPLNCVFQQVNDGTGTIIYLTPAACGQLVHPPPGTPSSPAELQVSQQFNPSRAVFFVPVYNSRSNGQLLIAMHLPYQPIATVTSETTNKKATPSIGFILTFIIIGALLSIGLVVTLIFVRF
jgi:hypothetical protein